MIKNSKKKKKAFTLVEVIIVLAIIAIIAAIAIPNLTKVREDSKIKADNSSIETMCRTIDTLLVDGSLTGTGTITIDYSGATVDLELAGADLAYDIDGDSTTDDKSNLLEYFAKVGKPQQKDMVKYVLTISEDANGVEVVTGETAKTGETAEEDKDED